MRITGDVNWREFLKDVLICSLGAYGGPEAHVGVFLDQMVIRRNYLSEEELIELIALTSILPGPTSTQTIVAIGHKKGGPLLAFLTMLVWALPVLIFMTLLSFLYHFLEAKNISSDGFRYIAPMAVGFIVVAAYRIGRKVVVDRLSLLLLFSSAAVTYMIRAPWMFPLVLLLGGYSAVVSSKEQNLWNRIQVRPPWGYLMAFVFLAVGGLVMRVWGNHLLLQLFESFYRYGYLVFGGGQVVVPVMYAELVEVHGYLTGQEFLTGYGLVQGLPGPMFSFSAYVGGLAAQQGTAMFQVAAAAISGIGIFLPGLLLIYFVYPVWEDLKKVRGIKVSLKGINAVAGGLICTAAVVLMQRTGGTFDNVLVTALTILFLEARKVPAPLIVLAVLAVGFLY